MRRTTALLVLALVHCAAFGGDFSKVGTSAAQFLKIGVGARAAGMGEAMAAATTDVDALYWNPAGIARIHRVSLAVSHAQWFADITHNAVGLAVPIGESDVLGISVIRLSTPEQEVTTVANPEGTGLFYQVSDLAIGVSFARTLTDRFAVGVTAKFVQQNAYNETAHALAIDCGTALHTGFHGLVIAMCVSNFGGTLQLEGRDLLSTSDIDAGLLGDYRPSSNLSTEQWPLPLNFRIGVALDLVGTQDRIIGSDEHRFTLAIDGNHPNDNVERANIGGEYGWRETLFLRAGYKIRYDLEKWTFGAGVRIDLGTQRFAFDYALVDFGVLGKTSRVSVGLEF